MASGLAGHHAFVAALRRSVFAGPGETASVLRERVGSRASGGPPIETPYDALAHQIGEAADRITDAQVLSVVTAAGSQKAAFELIVAAATAAGLRRWQQAITALKDAGDASA